MYLLDTSIISFWMRGDLQLIEKIKSCTPAILSLSRITLAEIYYGIEKSPVKKRERRLIIEHIKSQLEIFPFNERAAQKYGPLRAELEKQGRPVSERELQIAATALANKLCVVTPNTRSYLKKRILVQGQGGAEFQPAGILRYVEDLKRGTNTEIGPKDFFEIASKEFGRIAKLKVEDWYR